MKHLILILFSILLSKAYTQQVLARTNTGVSTNKSWQLYRQNSPTNVYGNSYVLVEVNHDSMFVYTSVVRIGILDNRDSIHPLKKYVSADSLGNLYQASFDSLTFPISQIDSLEEMLSDRLTLADGALLFKDINYVPSYTDVITALGFTPYDGATNPLGFVTSVPAQRRIEPFSGITNSSGVYTVTFSTPYPVAPNIQANIVNGTDTQTIRIISITTNGFSVLVRNRVDVVGLLPSYQNVTGASVDVVVTAK